MSKSSVLDFLIQHNIPHAIIRAPDVVVEMNVVGSYSYFIVTHRNFYKFLKEQGLKFRRSKAYFDTIELDISKLEIDYFKTLIGKNIYRMYLSNRAHKVYEYGSNSLYKYTLEQRQ